MLAPSKGAKAQEHIADPGMKAGEGIDWRGYRQMRIPVLHITVITLVDNCRNLFFFPSSCRVPGHSTYASRSRRMTTQTSGVDGWRRGQDAADT